MIIDDQEVYSTGLASTMIPVFKKAGIKVDHESVSQKVTDFSSLVTKVTPQTTVVVLPWQVAANAQQFGKNLTEQKKKATIFGTDGTQSSSFTIPGSYVSAFGPDINSIPATPRSRRPRRPRTRSTGRSARRCTLRRTSSTRRSRRSARRADAESRTNVLAAVKDTSEASSILGQPIKFDNKGDLIGRQVVPVQDQRQGQVQAGHQLVIS